MTHQPKIRLKPSSLDWLLDGLTFTGIIVVWIYLFYHYTSLPDVIPMHFNIKNEVDGWGSKLSVFILPIISTIIAIGLFFLNRYPYLFNYPTTITEENAFIQYRLATQMIRQLNFSMMLIFAYGLYEIIEIAFNRKPVLNEWFFPFLLIAIFSPIIVYFICARKAK